MQSHPVKLTMEIEASYLGQLVSQVVKQLVTPPEAKLNIVVDSTTNAPAPASEDADEDIPAPAISSTADPPRTLQTGPVSPVLPPDMATKYGLGTLCKHHHDYQGTGFSLRYLSWHRNCVECSKLREATRPRRVHGRRKGQRRHEKALAHALPVTTNGQHPKPVTAPPTVPPPPMPVVVPTIASNGTRPELPPHLQETCFLSPITCEVATHRYRGSHYTLRWLDDEDCCMCTVQTRTLKAGD